MCRPMYVFAYISAPTGGEFPAHSYLCYEHCRFDCDRSIINSRHLTKLLRSDCPVGVCQQLSETAKSDVCSVAE
jgi:hypothetical protein